MWFVVLGVLLILLNLLGIGPFGAWQWPGDWWKMCWPFGVAVLWWAYADKSGLTKRREMDKMEERKAARRRKSMEALGMNARERERAERGAKRGSSRPAASEQEQPGASRERSGSAPRSSRIDGPASSQFDNKS